MRGGHQEGNFGPRTSMNFLSTSCFFCSSAVGKPICFCRWSYLREAEAVSPGPWPLRCHVRAGGEHAHHLLHRRARLPIEVGQL